MGCSFCASTKAGFVRHLTPSEILEQVYAPLRDTGEPIDSLVLMGIGEPLDNYDNVLRFLELLNDPKGLNISPAACVAFHLRAGRQDLRPRRTGICS